MFWVPSYILDFLWHVSLIDKQDNKGVIKSISGEVAEGARKLCCLENFLCLNISKIMGPTAYSPSTNVQGRLFLKLFVVGC